VAASASLLTANPLVFFRFVRPANLATLKHTPDELPAEWQRPFRITIRMQGMLRRLGPIIIGS